MTPENLTPIAEAEFRRILKQSVKFGTAVARQTRQRLVAHFDRIQRGTAIGHKHQVARHPDSILCISEPPFVIFYDRHTRMVLRIVDGRRDLRELLIPE